MPFNNIISPKINPQVIGKDQSTKKDLETSLGGKSFKDTLGDIGQGVLDKNKQALQSANTQKLTFSNHAIDRMRQRGISYGPEMMQKLDNAVLSAKAKGAKETLVLTDDSALIVSVKNNKVVTVMDKAALKENVFTNIDSTVVI
ncbi:MAG: hypothetical protein HOO06_16520 [Bdellovibrionaceae bacterium]|nr:hypothetical protein [Pseudobdellovibrionaceae bacterium]